MEKTTQYSPQKILLVADYGKNDLAFKEVQQRLYEIAALRNLHIQIDVVSVDAFNTAQTAAVVAQATQRGNYDLVYHNTAPRKDIAKARVNNDGEALAYTHYVDGKKAVHVIGVFSQDASGINSFALLPQTKLPYGIRKVASETKGSQFRSRDVFPQHVIDALENKVKLESAPLRVDEPAHDSEVREANQVAEELLHEVRYNPLFDHGSASSGYVTFVVPEPDSVILLRDARKKFAQAELDILPLKYTKNPSTEAGFAAAQLALNSAQGSRRTIIILTDSNETIDNAENLYEATLDNGTHIISSDAKALVFVKSRIAAGGVRVFPMHENRVVEWQGEHVVIRGDSSSLSQAEWNKALTEPQGVVAVYTDGYGNIKLAPAYDAVVEGLCLGTSPDQRRLGAGQRALIAVKTAKARSEALLANGSFAVAEGELALSRGSSGWLLSADAKQDKQFFAELFLRGGSAAAVLGNPEPGEQITLQLKDIHAGHPPGTVIDGKTVSVELQTTQHETKGV